VMEGFHDGTSNLSGGANYYVCMSIMTTGKGDMLDGVTGVRRTDQYSRRARDYYVLGGQADSLTAVPIAENVVGFRMIARSSDSCSVELRVRTPRR
jgi:hypothetical protein